MVVNHRKTMGKWRFNGFMAICRYQGFGEIKNHPEIEKMDSNIVPF